VTRDYIRDEVKKCIATVSGIEVEEIANEASYDEDLGLDSLSVLEVAVHAEDLFKIKIVDPENEEPMQGLRTIEDTVRLIEQLIAEKVPNA
jgi:acyl carrier protein